MTTKTLDTLRKAAYEMVDKYFDAGGDPECILISKKDFINNQPAIQKLINESRIEELREVIDMAIIMQKIYPVIPLEKVSDRLKKLKLESEE